ncbi:MAG TPA: hypothetical protein VGY99_24920 [Candidatus Binataceae bacterium]|jgi:hypothetical protein|nr:hypothetical protein [Candidatus Binataceae bacterium]
MHAKKRSCSIHKGGDKEPVPVRPVKPTSYEMLGALFREISALVVVFAPLDKLIADGAISPSWWCARFLVSVLFFLLGVALEHFES